MGEIWFQGTNNIRWYVLFIVYIEGWKVGPGGGRQHFSLKNNIRIQPAATGTNSKVFNK